LVLVDTTVWIDLLRGADKPTVAMLRQLLGEGRTVTDCLIAQMAIDHDVELLHDDRDFQALAAVDRRLRLVPATGS